MGRRFFIALIFALGWASGAVARPTTRFSQPPPATTNTGFLQALPTARKYSLSTNIGLRLDVHGLRLTDAADLWYSGSGATQSSGTAAREARKYVDARRSRSR